MEGIKETKELLAFIIKLGESIDKSLEDGEITFMDMSNLVSAMMAANGAFSDINKVPAELKDLSEEESQELLAYAVEELDLNNDKAEEVIERSLEIGMKVYQLILIMSDKSEEAPEAPASETPA